MPPRRFVALGRTCVVKHQLDKIQSKEATLFFDRIVSNVSVVLEVLKTPREEMRSRFRLERLRMDPSRRHGPQCEVELLDFDGAVSYHDVPFDGTEADLVQLADRYERRHGRLLDIIQGSEPIVFIHFSLHRDMRDVELVPAIRALNPQLKFAVVIVGNETASFQDNLARIQLTQTASATTDSNNWQYNHLRWQDLWDFCTTIQFL